MGLWGWLTGKKTNGERPATPERVAPVRRARSAARIDLPRADKPIRLEGAERYFQPRLEAIGPGEHDGVITVRHVDPHPDELIVSVGGQQVGWIDRDERILTQVRNLIDRGLEVHGLVVVHKHVMQEPPTAWYTAGLHVPALAQLKAWLAAPESERNLVDVNPPPDQGPLMFKLLEGKRYQQELSQVSQTRAVRAAISTVEATSGKYAGQLGLAFAVKGAVIGTRPAAYCSAEMREAFQAGVTSCLVRVYGSSSTGYVANAEMPRHPKEH